MARYSPKSIVREYFAGRITRSEFLYRVVQAAVAHPPEQIAALLPAEELRAVQEEAEVPPQSAENSPRLFQIGSWLGPHDSEGERQEEQRL